MVAVLIVPPSFFWEPLMLNTGSAEDSSSSEKSENESWESSNSLTSNLREPKAAFKSSRPPRLSFEKESESGSATESYKKALKSTKLTSAANTQLRKQTNTWKSRSGGNFLLLGNWSLRIRGSLIAPGISFIGFAYDHRDRRSVFLFLASSVVMLAFVMLAPFSLTSRLLKSQLSKLHTIFSFFFFFAPRFSLLIITFFGFRFSARMMILTTPF